MFSFSSISLAATLAFAAFSSAAPLDPTSLGDTSGVLAPVTGLTSGATNTGGVLPRDDRGLGDHFNQCHDTIHGIYLDIAAVIDAKSYDKVGGLLADVVVALNVVIDVLPGYAGKDQDEWCRSGGSVVSVTVIANVLAEIFAIICEILYICLKVIVYIDITDVLCQIQTLICTIVTLTIDICAEITIDIVAHLNVSIFADLTIWVQAICAHTDIVVKVFVDLCATLQVN